MSTPHGCGDGGGVSVQEHSRAQARGVLPVPIEAQSRFVKTASHATTVDPTGRGTADETAAPSPPGGPALRHDEQGSVRPSRAAKTDRGVREAARLRNDLARTPPLGYAPAPPSTACCDTHRGAACQTGPTRSADLGKRRPPRILRGRRTRRRGRPHGELRVTPGGHIPWLSQPARLAHRMIVSRNAAHMKLAGRFLRKHTPRAVL